MCDHDQLTIVTLYHYFSYLSEDEFGAEQLHYHSNTITRGFIFSAGFSDGIQHLRDLMANLD